MHSRADWQRLIGSEQSIDDFLVYLWSSVDKYDEGDENVWLNRVIADFVN